MGDAGAKSLATALKKNTTLKNLWLGECEAITDEVRLSTLKQRHIPALAHVHVQGQGGGLNEPLLPPHPPPPSLLQDCVTI